MYHSSKVFGFEHVSALTIESDTKLASWNLIASCNISPLPPHPSPTINRIKGSGQFYCCRCYDNLATLREFPTTYFRAAFFIIKYTKPVIHTYIKITKRRVRIRKLHCYWRFACIVNLNTMNTIFIHRPFVDRLFVRSSSITKTNLKTSC